MHIYRGYVQKWVFFLHFYLRNSKIMLYFAAA